VQPLEELSNLATIFFYFWIS